MNKLKERPNIYAAVIIIVGIVCLLFLRVGFKMMYQDHQPISIVVTSAPVASVVSQVGGQHIKVLLVTKQQISDLQGEQQLQNIFRDARLIIGIGGEVDSWILPYIEKYGYRDMFLELLHYVPTMRMADGRVNPYIWYTPSNVKQMGKVVRDALTQEDAVNGGDYHVRAHLLGEQMDTVAQRISDELQMLDGVGLVLFHQGFQYFFSQTPLGDDVYLISEENLESFSLLRFWGLLTMAGGYKELYLFVPVTVPDDILTVLRTLFHIELRYIPDTTVAPVPDGIQDMLESSLNFVVHALHE